MSETAVDLAATKPRKSANGPAGPVRIKREQVFTLADAVGEDTRAILDIRGKRLPVVYNPNRITHKDRREILQRHQGEDDANPSHDWVLEFLSRVIVSWELYSNPDDLEPYPTNVQSLDLLPDEFLSLVVQGIQEHVNPPEPESSFGST